MKARLPEGYGGGAQSMNAMIRQAQKMQEQMTEKQEELAAREFHGTAGGGMVEVVMTGKREITALTIKPDVVDPDDIEMLQDLVMAAVNETYRQIEEITNAEMEKITGGLNVPGIL